METFDDSMVAGLKTIINQLNMYSPMFPNHPSVSEEGYKFFSNDVFSIRPYWEGECTCGFHTVEEQFDEEHKNLSIQELGPIYRAWVDEGNVHSSDCKLVLANFRHHRSGLEINWHYKIGHDMYANKEISDKQWKDIVADCVASIIGGE